MWIQLRDWAVGEGVRFLAKAREISLFVKSSVSPTRSHSLPFGGNFLLRR